MNKDRLLCKQCANTDMSSMNFSNDGKYLYCQACGSNTPLYDAYIVYKEDMSDRVASVVVLAQHQMENGDYEHAAQEFHKALAIASDTHAAWWGLYICEYAFAEYYGFRDKYNNSGHLIKANILIDLINRYANKAIENAPQDIAILYGKSIQEPLAFIQNARTATNTKQDKRCYVATAVYGSDNSPQVVILRNYRDRVLLKTIFGRGFIRFYYFWGAKLAKHIPYGSYVAVKTRGFLDNLIDYISEK